MQRMKSEEDQCNVVEAVFALRTAALSLGRSEARAHNPVSIDELIRKRVDLEEKTAQAIVAYTTCGRAHCDEHAPARRGINGELGPPLRAASRTRFASR